MRRLRALFLRIIGLFHSAQRDKEFATELESHLEMQIGDNLRAGMSPEEARRTAILRLGPMQQAKEVYRRRRGLPMVETLLRDFLFGFRMLRKNPGFSLVAVITLALGIGASTAVFSVVRGVLIESVPFRDPSRLVAVLDSRPAQGVDWLYVSRERFDRLSLPNTVFERIAAANGGFVTMANGGAPHMVDAESVSAEFLPMLGVKPMLGRLFTAEEERPGNDDVALLSYRFWRDEFGGDPAILGKRIGRTAQSRGNVVIGVLPQGFQFIRDDIAVWTPLVNNPASPYRALHLYLLIARLKPGVTNGQAQAAANGVAAELAEQYPFTSAGWTFTVRDFQQFFTGRDNVRGSLLVLLSAVGMLLLIACSNLANLLLSRSMARKKEIAVRLAIGASRARIAGQLFMESLLLGLAGGAAGFLLARAVFQSLVGITPNIATFRPDALRIDWGIFVFAVFVSVAATLLFGLTPAVRASRLELNETLRESSRGTCGNRRDRKSRNLLVVSEVALAMMLLAGAALLLESVRRLKTDDLGFNPDRVLTMWTCCLDPANYPAQRDIASYYNQVFTRLREVPGVESASASTRLPMRQLNGISIQFELRGSSRGAEHEPAADLFFTESEYFHTMRIPLMRGRFFDRHDTFDHAPVAVINESMARRFWAGQDPIGGEIRPHSGDGAGQWHRIVGVVADAKQRGRGMDARPTYYLNFSQEPVRYAYFVIRTRAEPISLANAVKNAIWSVDHTLPLEDVRTIEQAMDASIATQRFSTLLLSLFAALALALAALGVYGVTSYGVAQRTQEVGVRMSLGASRWAILGMIVREVLTVAAIGVGLGLAGTLVLTRFMRGLLYGIGATDPVALGGAVVFLSLVALIACGLPALRATRVDPVTALRSE
jgi:predicted permease